MKKIKYLLFLFLSIFSISLMSCDNELKPVEQENKKDEFENTEYKWDADYSKCTATKVCKNDSTKTIIETVKATVEEVKPTCDSKGSKTYTAVFLNSAFEMQTYTVETAALNHDYDEAKYSWNADFSKCTATKVCKNDSLHNITETANSTVNVVDATYTSKGSKTYTAVFTNSEFSAQKHIIEIEALEHKYADVHYEFSEDLTQCTASKECLTDSSLTITETVESIVNVVSNPTKDSKGLTTYTAVFTNPAFETQVYEEYTEYVMNNHYALSPFNNSLLYSHYENNLLLNEIYFALDEYGTKLNWEYIYDNKKLVKILLKQSNNEYIIRENDYNRTYNIDITYDEFGKAVGKIVENNKELLITITFHDNGLIKNRTIYYDTDISQSTTYNENGRLEYELFEGLEAFYEYNNDGSVDLKVKYEENEFVVNCIYDDNILKEWSSSIDSEENVVSKIEFEYEDDIIKTFKYITYTPGDEPYYYSGGYNKYDDKFNLIESGIIHYSENEIVRKYSYEYSYNENNICTKCIFITEGKEDGFEFKQQVVYTFEYKDNNIIKKTIEYIYSIYDEIYYTKEIIDYTYDSNNNLIKRVATSYDKDGNVYLVSTEEYEYNDDGLKIYQSSLQTGESFYWIIDEYTYNDNNELLTQTTTWYDEDGNSTGKEVINCTYDDNNDLVKKATTSYFTNGNVKEIEERTYGDINHWIVKCFDEYGNLSNLNEVKYYYIEIKDKFGATCLEERTIYSHKIYCNDGYNRESIIETEFDENGVIIKSTNTYIRMDSDNNVLSYEKETKEYKYDGNGNTIYLATTRYDSEDNIILKTVEEMEYDKNNNLTNKTSISYNSESIISEKIVEEYMFDDFNRKIYNSKIYYDSEDNVISSDIYEYEYNSNGEIIMESNNRYYSGFTYSKLKEYDQYGNVITDIDIKRDSNNNIINGNEGHYEYYSKDNIKAYDNKVYDNGYLKDYYYGTVAEDKSSIRIEKYYLEGILSKSNEKRLDSNENIIYECNIYYDAEGNEISKEVSEYTYNNQGNIILESFLDYDNGKLISKYTSETQYDGNNNKIYISHIYTNSEGNVNEKVIHKLEYDSNNNEIKQTIYEYDSNNIISYTTIIVQTYDENNNKTYKEYVRYDFEGNIVSKNEENYKYDTYGNEVYHDSIKYNLDGDEVQKEIDQSTYNDNNDILEEIHLSYKNGELVYNVSHVYKYEGEILIYEKYEEYNMDSIVSFYERYYYSNGNIRLSIDIIAHDDFNEVYEYEYDEYGRVIKENQYLEEKQK